MKQKKQKQSKAPKFVRIGQCLNCGRCCNMRTLLPGVKEVANLLGERSGDCPHLCRGTKTALCNQYRTRPPFCAAYPAEHADLIEGCGFSFVEVANA